MNKMLILALALTLALTSSGCIANMDNLKDRLGGGDEESVAPAATTDETPNVPSSPVVNETPKKPPVARMSVFATGGALLFKSTFTAEDPGELIFVEAKGTINLIAGDSEPVERGATITGYAWTANGKPIEATAQKATFEVAEPGVYTLKLTVTDSNGKSDAQTVKVGLMPEPYEEAYEFVAGQVVGQEGDAPADVAWDLAEPAEPATVQSVVIVAEPPLTCDAILELVDKDGNVLGSADNVGHQDLTQTETLELGAIAFGAYTIRIAPYTCVALEVPITVTVTYLPVVEGLDANAGHGGHAGH